MSKILLAFSSSTSPYKIKIFSSNNLQIFEKPISNNFGTTLFCSQSPYIIIKATHKTQTITKYINIKKCSCVSFSVWFNFQDEAILKQKIELLDQNYNIPINNAVLRFSN